MAYWDELETRPEEEDLLNVVDEEIAITWFLVQSEAECALEDADIAKMRKLLDSLGELEERRVNLLEAIDRRDGTW